MKTWFFLSFLALLLIQGSAGATTLHASLAPINPSSCTQINPPPLKDSRCWGTGTFTLTNADNLDLNQRSFSYRITLSPDESLNNYFFPPSYPITSLANTPLLANKTIDPQFSINLPSVVDIFIGNQPDPLMPIIPILEIAQLQLTRDASGNPFVSEFITRDPNIFINLNDNSLSGTMSYSECSSTNSDGSCDFLSNPGPLLSCQDYLYVHNNDLIPTGLDLRGNICGIPTPSSISLFGIGLAGLGLLRQRRKPHLPAL